MLADAVCCGQNLGRSGYSANAIRGAVNGADRGIFHSTEYAEIELENAEERKGSSEQARERIQLEDEHLSPAD